MKALYPSKSGLMNKHIVKHIVNKHFGCLSTFPVRVRTNEQTYRETYRKHDIVKHNVKHTVTRETYCIVIGGGSDPVFTSLVASPERSALLVFVSAVVKTESSNCRHCLDSPGANVLH